MSTGAAIARREQLILASAVVAPFAVYFLVRFLGFARYFTFAAAGTVGLVCAAAVFLRPREGLFLLLFYVYLGSLASTAASALAAILLAAVVLGQVRGDRLRLEDPVFWYANGFLLLIAVGSILFAVTLSLAMQELVRYFKILLVAYLIVQLVRTPLDLRRMMNVIFWGAVGTVYLGIVLLLFGISMASTTFVGGDGSNMYIPRFTGAHPNANLAAALMCSAMPLGIFAFKTARRSLKVFYVIGIVTLIVAIFATFSRSVVFPFTFITAAVLVREARSRRVYLSLVVLLVLGILLAPDYYWQRVTGLRDAFETTTLDWSVYTRLLALQTAWEMFLDHPFTGVGIGNFWDAAAYNLFVRMVVHNTYLEVLVGMGVFGLLAFLMILLSGLRHSVAGARHHWTHHPRWLRSASFYWVLSAVSICMSAFFGSMPFRYFLWVPVAAGLVIGNLLREDRRAAR